MSALSNTIGPWPTIEKPVADAGSRPNLADYALARARFSWDDERRLLDGLPGRRGLNIAHEAVRRHAAGARANRVAIRWLGAGDRRRELTYQELWALSRRFARALGELGVAPGERVCTLLGRVPELYVTAIGTLAARAVYCPLFANFGPEPIRARLGLAEARVLVTTPGLYRRKVAALRDALPRLEHVLLVGDGDGPAPGTQSWQAVVDAASDGFAIEPTDPEDFALLHFTSGTTGQPKGAIHVHGAVVAHHATARMALDLRPGDVFWCTADPGWVTGTSYGIVAPLVVGATLVVDGEEFDAARWYRILEQERVAVWYTAPTALRMLMRHGVELARRHDLGALRFAASAGEPLNPEVVVWSQEAFGRPVHDNWWQTETGGIMIANLAALPVEPGAMGRPLPGIEAAIVARDEDGGVKVLERPGREGELALRVGWPSMFRGYLGDEARYRACFADGWYLTGDLARRDPDGTFWFVGRADDMIKSAGHLIGPFEVESALMDHPAVAEVAAIGKPDPIAMSVVKAFVVLKPSHEPDDELRRELLAHGRQRLGPAVAPREIAFEDDLPKTRSGKIMRRLLKARELGLPEGDLSTLEPATTHQTDTAQPPQGERP